MKFNTLFGSAAIALSLLAAPVAAEKLTIASVVFQQDQFFRTIQMGMSAAAKKAGVTLLEGNSDSQPDREIGLIDTHIARGVDAIVISPVSAVASIPALARAKARGIQIVTYNSTINDASIPAAYLNSQQPYVMGRMAVEAAIAVARGESVDFTVIVPVLGLSRTDRAGVEAFQNYLRSLN